MAACPGYPYMGPGALAMRNLLNGELKAFGTSSSVPPLLMLCATSNFLEKAFGNLENSSVKRSALRRGKGFLEKYQPGNDAQEWRLTTHAWLVRSGPRCMCSKGLNLYRGSFMLQIIRGSYLWIATSEDVLCNAIPELSLLSHFTLVVSITEGLSLNYALSLGNLMVVNGAQRI